MSFLPKHLNILKLAKHKNRSLQKLRFWFFIPIAKI